MAPPLRGNVSSQRLIRHFAERLATEVQASDEAAGGRTAPSDAPGRVERVGDYFHATTDAQEIRNEVFKVILAHNVKIQATICEKAKASPSTTTSKARFYKYPWFYTLKHGIAPYVNAGDELLVTAASIGSKKERMTFCRELDDVVTQTIKVARWAVDFRSSHCDPCLQVADYCAWAIQRKWERGDTRSYSLIKHMITREYDLWERGTKLHY
ncbi:MAG: hypothetical protein V4586_06395 [Pseudomonadota bacterium]